jgi:hypothetical protein
MQLKRLPVVRLCIVISILVGTFLVMSSMGGVQASTSRQAATATVTPLADDLANMGSSGTCQEMFSTYYQWLEQGGKVRFYFVTNESGEPNDDPTRGNVASYATGELSYADGSKTMLTGDGLQYFNDRNTFDPRSADKVRLTISPTNIQVTLLSWGNATGNFTPPHCSNGALIALGEGNPNRDGDNKVMIVFTFHRSA